MKDGSCVILGTVHDMIPTFEHVERKLFPEWKITGDVYKGDVANRGKGTLMIKNYRAQ
jgi:formylmethanofuran dehydrogenase subunit C